MLEAEFYYWNNWSEYVDTIEGTHRTWNVFSADFIFLEISSSVAVLEYLYKKTLPEFCSLHNS